MHFKFQYASDEANKPTEPVTDLTKEVPVSLELLQRIWTELYRSPETEVEHLAFQATLEDVVDLLDKWHALPELEDD